MLASSAAMTTDISETGKSADRISIATYEDASRFRLSNGDAIAMF
jgi:hypothetical protein